MLLLRENPGLNFTCPSCIVCYDATQIFEIFHILQLLYFISLSLSLYIYIYNLHICKMLAPSNKKHIILHGTENVKVRSFLLRVKKYDYLQVPE